MIEAPFVPEEGLNLIWRCLELAEGGKAAAYPRSPVGDGGVGEGDADWSGRGAVPLGAGA